MRLKGDKRKNHWLTYSPCDMHRFYTSGVQNTVIGQ